MYQIIIHKQALKELVQLPKKDNQKSHWLLINWQRTLALWDVKN